MNGALVCPLLSLVSKIEVHLLAAVANDNGGRSDYCYQKYLPPSAIISVPNGIGTVQIK